MARSGYVHHRLLTVVVLALVYAAIWFVLSDNQGWGFGLVTIALAVWCALLAKLTLPRMAWRYLPAFVFFFLNRMVVGGIDVARRTLRSQPDVEPGWVRHSLASSSPFDRLLLSAIAGLFPGTLAARIDGDTMLVHALDTRRDWQDDLVALEKHLTRLFPPAETAA